MHKQVFKKGHNSVRKGPTKNSSLNPQHTMDDNHRKVQDYPLKTVGKNLLTDGKTDGQTCQHCIL